MTGYESAWRWTPYHHAIASGCLVEEACNKDRIDEPDAQGVTPLHLACLVGNLEDVKLLLELGADPNASVDQKFGSMPLITAVRHNHVEIVKELMKAAPEQKNHVDIFGKSAVDYATTPEMISILNSADGSDQQTL